MQGVGVTINAIHYNHAARDGGREWIEIENTGSDPVLLASLRVMIGDRGHKIVPLSDVADLAPGERAAIVQNEALFRADYPTFDGAIFHSSFNIPNGSTIISLVDNRGAVIAQFDTNRTIAKHTSHIHHKRGRAERQRLAECPTCGTHTGHRSRGGTSRAGGSGAQTVLGTDTLPAFAVRPVPPTNISTSVWLLGALVLAAAAAAVWWYSDRHVE